MKIATAVLVLSVLTTGLIAGLYFAFTVAVMPGLARSSNTEFVGVMQRINVAILNGWFLGAFVGALLLAIGAAVLNRSEPGFAWIVAGVVLYAVTIAITAAGNVPLNDALLAAGNVSGSEVSATAARAAFEARWVALNLVRTVIGSASVVALALGLGAR